MQGQVSEVVFAEPRKRPVPIAPPIAMSWICRKLSPRWSLECSASESRPVTELCGVGCCVTYFSFLRRFALVWFGRFRVVGIHAYFLVARRKGASRFLRLCSALELVDSDFTGLPFSYITDKELCRE